MWMLARFYRFNGALELTRPVTALERGDDVGI
jgi:hypothetical protein